MQLMFETFNVSGFYASEQAVLSLYAVGRISGCTVDIGHGKIGPYFNILFDQIFVPILCCTYIYFSFLMMCDGL